MMDKGNIADMISSSLYEQHYVVPNRQHESDVLYVEVTIDIDSHRARDHKGHKSFQFAVYGCIEWAMNRRKEGEDE